MTTTISTGSQSVFGATSITVSLGSTPAVGDLVVVFLGVSNQIVVHPPGWNSTVNGTQVNQPAWFLAESLRARTDNSGLSVFYHTWNAADTGSSATFTFSPAPTLGIGDKDLSTANAVALAVVLSPCAVQEFSQQGIQDDRALSVRVPPQKQANGGGFNLTAAYFNGQGNLSTSDAGAVNLGGLNTASGSLSGWSSAGSAGYQPTLSSSAPGELLSAFLAVNDATPNIYNPPVIYEAPAADNALFYRYTHQRYYTVLNNSGVFTVIRFPTTDQLFAATRFFVGNAPISAAEYTNILNAGIGGDFRFSPTGS